MKHAVCLLVGPQATSAFVPDLPGCWVLGRTRDRALVKARMAAVEWRDWMEEHGEDVPEEPGGLEVAEVLAVGFNPAEAGAPELLFGSELAPVARGDVERTVRLMGHARADLLDLVEGLGEPELDRAPPGGPRTVRGCLAHIAQVEPWYLSRLGIAVPEAPPCSVFELLALTRERVIERLEGFPARKMRGVFRPRRWGNKVCDLWTARKVLRRLVDHERLHTRYVERALGTGQRP